MDLEQEFKKETGFDAYVDNELQPKIAMSYYVEWLETKIEHLTFAFALYDVKEQFPMGINKNENKQ